MKIWHQSSVDLDNYPVYKASLAQHYAKVAAAGTQIVLHGVPESMWHGMSPSEVMRVPYAYHKAMSRQLLHNVYKAEQEGYDAFVIGTYTEPLLRECRSLVDIPVISMPESTEVIRVLSEVGWATPGELAKQTGINRATVYRLLNTLELSGYVYCRPGDGSYFLTERFKHIADGIKDEDWVSQVISPYLGRLLTQVQWPSDFALFTSGRFVIRESTHRFSSMSVNRAMVGKSRPLLRSALGIAFLSAVTDDSRQEILDLVELTTDEKLIKPDGHKELMKKLR